VWRPDKRNKPKARGKRKQAARSDLGKVRGLLTRIKAVAPAVFRRGEDVSSELVSDEIAKFLRTDEPWGRVHQR